MPVEGIQEDDEFDFGAFAAVDGHDAITDVLVALALLRVLRRPLATLTSTTRWVLLRRGAGRGTHLDRLRNDRGCNKLRKHSQRWRIIEERLRRQQWRAD